MGLPLFQRNKMAYKIPKRKSKEFQKQFKIERREHPAFTDDQVKEIVTDHFILKKKDKVQI